MRRFPLLFGVVALAAGLNAAALGQDVAYRVIVHPSHSGTAIERSIVKSIFLRQATRWADGSDISPIDQSTRSPVREAFSKDALGESVAAVQTYWQKQISAGRARPPAVKSSDAEVLALVAATPGAIGYVSAEADTSAVKVLHIID